MQLTFDPPGRRRKTGDGKCMNLQEVNYRQRFSNAATMRADKMKKKKRIEVDGLKKKKKTILGGQVGPSFHVEASFCRLKSPETRRKVRLIVLLPAPVC